MSSRSLQMYQSICSLLEDKHSDFNAHMKRIQSEHPDVHLAYSPSKKESPASIDSIIVRSPKQSGTGTKVMSKITQAADQHGVKLSLSPSNAYGSDVTRLKRFYKRFNFKQNSGKNKDFSTKNTFIRDPK